MLLSSTSRGEGTSVRRVMKFQTAVSMNSGTWKARNSKKSARRKRKATAIFSSKKTTEKLKLTPNWTSI